VGWGGVHSVYTCFDCVNGVGSRMSFNTQGWVVGVVNTKYAKIKIHQYLCVLMLLYDTQAI